MRINSDEEFHQASVDLAEVWADIDFRLFGVNNNLQQVRSEWWRLIRNLSLLRTNRQNLRIINTLLRGNMDLIAAREAYIHSRFGEM